MISNCKISRRWFNLPCHGTRLSLGNRTECLADLPYFVFQARHWLQFLSQVPSAGSLRRPQYTHRAPHTLCAHDTRRSPVAYLLRGYFSISAVIVLYRVAICRVALHIIIEFVCNPETKYGGVYMSFGN